MVRALGPPERPLRNGRTTFWEWSAPKPRQPWQWCRVYHRGVNSPNGHTPRTYGPLARFDPQRPAPSGAARVDPDGRDVLYVGADLTTSACEVFGEAATAALCPGMRVALLRPLSQLILFDLVTPGSAMMIGALPALADGPYARTLTQEWARAMYEDQPTGAQLDGVAYRSAYDGGRAMALWDCASRVETVVTSGTAQDFALTDARVLGRLYSGLGARRITITHVSPADCRRCR